MIQLCPLKHYLPDMPLSCTRVMRHRCGIYYKYTVISVHTSAKLTIRTTCNNIKTVDIENQVIQSAVQIPHTATPDAITDSLLNLPTMTLTLHHNYVTQLTHQPAFPSTNQTAIPKITLTTQTYSKFWPRRTRVPSERTPPHSHLLTLLMKILSQPLQLN